MRFAGCLLLCVAAAFAQEPTRQQVPGSSGPGIKIASATRPVVMFTRMERGLLAAIQQKKSDAIKAALAPDFELLQPAPPGAPVPLDQWLEQLSKAPAFAAYRVSQMSVHTPSNDVAIVSFMQSLRLEGAKFEDAFVIDYWVNDSGTWKLKTRYSSSVQNFSHPAAPKPTGKE